MIDKDIENNIVLSCFYPIYLLHTCLTDFYFNCDDLSMFADYLVDEMEFILINKIEEWIRNRSAD